MTDKIIKINVEDLEVGKLYYYDLKLMAIGRFIGKYGSNVLFEHKKGNHGYAIDKDGSISFYTNQRTVFYEVPNQSLEN